MFLLNKQPFEKLRPKLLNGQVMEIDAASRVGFSQPTLGHEPFERSVRMVVHHSWTKKGPPFWIVSFFLWPKKTSSHILSGEFVFYRFFFPPNTLCIPQVALDVIRVGFLEIVQDGVRKRDPSIKLQRSNRE